MGQAFTAIIVTDALGEFPGGEFARRLNNRSFAVQPAGLNGIEPGALGGQAADEKPEAPRAFRVAIVLSNPSPDGGAGMPRGIIPDQDPGGLASRVQPGTGPSQELGREGRDGAVCDKAQPDVLRIGPHHAVAGQRLGLGIVRVGGPFK